MKLATSRLLDKADVALATAATLLDGGDPERSVGRSYYAMFYAGEASVCEDAFHRSPDGDYHRWLMQASNERSSEEGGTAPPTPAQAARSIDLARGLIEAVRQRD